MHIRPVAGVYIVIFYKWAKLFLIEIKPLRAEDEKTFVDFGCEFVTCLIQKPSVPEIKRCFRGGTPQTYFSRDSTARCSSIRTFKRAFLSASQSTHSFDVKIQEE